VNDVVCVCVCVYVCVSLNAMIMPATQASLGCSIEYGTHCLNDLETVLCMVVKHWCAQMILARPAAVTNRPPCVERQRDTSE